MSGSITFNTYPSTNRVPGVYFEVNNSQANSGQINQRTLILGQMLSAGTATANIPILCTGIGDTQTEMGIGSMLANMVAQYRNADNVGEVWLLPIADNGAGTKTAVTATVTGPATAAGTLSLYLAGNIVEVGVNSGDSATTVGANIVLAIAAMPTLPCTATASSGVVTITARNAGVAAGDLDAQLNFMGKVNNENTPAGIAVAFATTAGTGDPTSTAINTALANVTDHTFDFIVVPWTGSTQLGAIESFLSDTTGRWSYSSELFGGAFSAYRGTAAALTTFGLLNNNQHVSILGYFGSPTPAYMVAADYAAVCAASLRVDPALPLQNVLLNFIAPQIANRFTFSERNTLLYSGISTFKVNDAQQVILERSVTTYQTNLAGAADDSYLDTETLYTLMFLIRDLRTDLQSKFARVKLVADGTRISFGQNFVTPSTVKNEVIANYRKNAALGLCQDPDTFSQNVQATDAGNGQVSILWPGNLANQLRVIAVLAQFIKT